MDISSDELKQSILSLLRLQEIDGILFKLNQETKLPPSDLKELQAKIGEAQKTLRLAERAFRGFDRERRALELRRITLQEDLRKAEVKRKEVRNTKEEFSASKEIENFQKKTADIAKQIAEKDQLVAEKQKVLDEKKKKFEDVQAQLKECEDARTARVAEINAEKEDLLKKRDSYISKVNEDIFSMYERVQKLRRGSGVAVVRDGICTGCFVAVPPQTNSFLQRMDKLITCSSCSRILAPSRLLDENPSENTEENEGDGKALKTSSA